MKQKPKRNRLIKACIVAIIFALAFGVYRVVRDFSDKNQLLIGCFSDRFLDFAGAWTTAVEKNKGRWPTKDEVIALIDKRDAPNPLTCVKSNEPFIWNPKSPDQTAKSNVAFPLIWCPPESHGRHVAVLVYFNGEFEARMMTQDELDELRKLSESPLPSTAPVDP